MKKAYKVVITDFMHDTPDIENKMLGDIAQVVVLDASNESQLVGRIEDADSIMVYHSINLTDQTISRLDHCKLIVRCGVGFDNVDCDAAATQNIPVTNIPDYGTEEVADTALGMMLALTRGIGPLNSILRDSAKRDWTYLHIAPLQRLRGQGFGIIGLGRVGAAAAQRAKALGMTVVFYDPYLPDGYDKAMGITQALNLEQLLEQAYVLSAHCPLTEQTRHMVDAAAIARMARGTYVINTSRGLVVDTAAVAEAIASGQLAGAAIDVLAHEPPPDDDPLIASWRNPEHPAYHRVIINPHAAFYSEQGLDDMRTKGASACRAALLGDTIRNVVN